MRACKSCSFFLSYFGRCSNNQTKLVRECSFPWLATNLKAKGKPVAGGQLTATREIAGIRVGFMGLVESEWIDTLPDLPEDLVYVAVRGGILKTKKWMAETVFIFDWHFGVIVSLQGTRTFKSARRRRRLSSEALGAILSLPSPTCARHDAKQNNQPTNQPTKKGRGIQRAG